MIIYVINILWYEDLLSYNYGFLSLILEYDSMDSFLIFYKCECLYFWLNCLYYWINIFKI